MARMARVVVPFYPHHVTQRGNRRQRIDFGDDHDKRDQSGNNWKCSKHFGSDPFSTADKRVEPDTP